MGLLVSCTESLRLIGTVQLFIAQRTTLAACESAFRTLIFSILFETLNWMHFRQAFTSVVFYRLPYQPSAEEDLLLRSRFGWDYPPLLIALVFLLRYSGCYFQEIPHLIYEDN